MIRVIYFLPSILIMILIFLGSNDPSSGEKSDFITKFIFKIFNHLFNYKQSYYQEISLSFCIRKLAHITEYAILNLSLYIALIKNFKYKKSQNIVIASLISLFYSMTDEYHQSFIVGRVGTYKDVLIDLIGILLISLIINKINQLKKINQK